LSQFYLSVKLAFITWPESGYDLFPGRMPKSHKSRHNKTNQIVMQSTGLHQRKLYAIIEAAIAFLALLLPWTRYKMGGFNMFYGGGGGGSIDPDNGFRSWGWLVVIGVLGVIVTSLLGDKTKEYDKNMKLGAMGSFALIALGAIIYFTRLSSVGTLQTREGIPVTVASGMGIWSALVAGLIGLAWVSGVLDQFTTKKTAANQPPPAAPTV
jgi:hypothetical protein